MTIEFNKELEEQCDKMLQIIVQLTSLKDCPKSIKVHLSGIFNDIKDLNVLKDLKDFPKTSTSSDDRTKFNTIYESIINDNGLGENLPPVQDNEPVNSNNQFVDQFNKEHTVEGNFASGVSFSKAVINDKGLIDVRGSIKITPEWVDENGKLKVSFGTVTENFDCSKLHLQSLVGVPIIVKGHFSCANNDLTSLEGEPMEVGQAYWCNGNKLTDTKSNCRTRGKFISHNNPVASKQHGGL